MESVGGVDLLAPGEGMLLLEDAEKGITMEGGGALIEPGGVEEGRGDVAPADQAVAGAVARRGPGARTMQGRFIPGS